MSLFSVVIIACITFVLGFALGEARHREASPAAPMPAVAHQIASSAPAANPVQVVDIQTRIEEHIRDGRYAEANSLLGNYLEAHGDSVRGWYLMARVQQQLKQPKAAVAAWFRYLALERDRDNREHALQELKHYLQQLKDAPSLFAEDYAWLLAQLDQLASLTLADGELHLLMAWVAMQLKDTYQAQYHALMAANDPQAQERAENLLGKLNADKLPKELAIPLERFGNQYVVAVNIEGNPARLLLDTGASLSGLSSVYLGRYPSLIKDARPIRLNTAAGTQDSVLFTVTSLGFGGLHFNRHMLAQLPMDGGSDFDGLLGVDILGRFDFVIDQDQALLKLKSRKASP
jgi:predicted aspartyl protease